MSEYTYRLTLIIPEAWVPEWLELVEARMKQGKAYRWDVEYIPQKKWLEMLSDWPVRTNEE